MTVQVYRSTDANAPSLTGQTGSLITVLNACLVTGYGQVTLTSLTRSGAIATATVSGGHGFTTGTFVTIAGAVQVDYNGTYSVTVTSSTTFTYTVANSPVTPATGTITAIRTPCGWTKPFTSGSTGAVYRQGAGSNGFYLNVDETGTLATSNLARARGFETMTAWSNGTNPYPGTNPFPTDGMVNQGLYWLKSSTTDATVRPWFLIGTSKGFMMYSNYSSDGAATTTQAQVWSFGDLVSTGVTDAYATLITGNESSNQSSNPWSTNSNGSNTPGHFMARSWTQQGSAILVGRSADITGSSVGGGVYPDPVDGSFKVSPTMIVETNSPNIFTVRGILPGIWYPLFRSQQLIDGVQYVISSGSLAGKTLEVRSSYSSPTLFEVSNTY